MAFMTEKIIAVQVKDVPTGKQNITCDSIVPKIGQGDQCITIYCNILWRFIYLFIYYLDLASIK